MSRFKRSYNRREVEQILRRNGWVFDRCKGSHSIFKNDKGEHLTMKLTSVNPKLIYREMKKHDLVV